MNDYRTEKWFKRELKKEKHAKMRAKHRRQRQNFQAKKRGTGNHDYQHQQLLKRLLRVLDLEWNPLIPS